MPKNQIWRIGLDASGFESGAKKTEKSADSMSKKVEKALKGTTLSGRVSDILGLQGQSTQITNITDANAAQARQQLQDLIEMRKQLEGLGFNENSEDWQYGAVSERIAQLTYDLQLYDQAVANSSNTQAMAAAQTRDTAAALTQESNAAAEAGVQVDGHSRKLAQAAAQDAPLSRIPGRFSAIGKNAGSSVSGLSKMVSGLKRVVTASFGFQIVSSLLGRLRSIISSYVSNNEQLQAQVNALKNSLGQALAPAINVVMNALNAIMPVIVGVGNAIGELIGMLGGVWSQGTTGANNYTKATGGAASAQKKLNRELMSFDEINKLQGNSSSGGGGGSSSSNVGTITGTTPAWLQRFKTSFSDLFSSDEFQAENIGGKIALALQNGIDWVQTEAAAFDWTGLGATLGSNLGSFFEKPLLQSISKACGSIFMGIGQMLATAIATSIAPWWEETKADFEEKLEAAGTAGAAAWITGFVLKIGGGWFGSMVIKPFLEGVADTLEGCGYDGAASWMRGLAEKFDWNESIDNWVDSVCGTTTTDKTGAKMRGAGATAAEEFAEGASETSHRAGYMVEFCGGVVRSANEELDINSPSRVFAEIGGYAAEGFQNGMVEKLESAKTGISNMLAKIKQLFQFSWSFPSIKLPHLTVTWEPVEGILSRVLGSTAVPHFGIQWYANGGILDGAQIFGAMGNNLLGGGEAGREAVLPLDRNTGWMDELASRIYVMMQNGAQGAETTIKVPVTLDGKVLTEVVAKGLRQRERATGMAY